MRISWRAFKPACATVLVLYAAPAPTPLDHILISPHLLPHSEVDIVHVNAEFADRASDHDPIVARLYLPRMPGHLPR